MMDKRVIENSQQKSCLNNLIAFSDDVDVVYLNFSKSLQHCLP